MAEPERCIHCDEPVAVPLNGGLVTAACAGLGRKTTTELRELEGVLGRLELAEAELLGGPTVGIRETLADTRHHLGRVRAELARR